MNYNISFEERAKIAKEHLLKQLPTTLEQAQAQALWLKTTSKTNHKKQKD